LNASNVRDRSSSRTLRSFPRFRDAPSELGKGAPFRRAEEARLKRYKMKIRTFQVAHEEVTDFGLIEGPEDVVPLLRAILRDACDADRESFIVVALNSRGRAIGYKVICVGTLTASLVGVKETFSVAFAFASACSLIVAHSHPSGDPSPSAEDLELTRRLVNAGEILGLPILDHIVLASSGADDSPWRSIVSLALAHAEQGRAREI
jgi:hypothetical protein